MTTVLAPARPPALCGESPWAPGQFRRSDDSGPRVLVVYASRHGATREIAAALARGLVESDPGRRLGVRTVLAPVQRRPDPTAFDAVVLGSPIYADGWLEAARRYGDAAASELRNRSTWLFSSGLVEPVAGRRREIDDARRIGARIGAHGHRIFGGRLEPRVLSASERSAWPVGTRRAGDLRPWAAVRAWSAEIATELVRTSVAPATP